MALSRAWDFKILSLLSLLAVFRLTGAGVSLIPTLVEHVCFARGGVAQLVRASACHAEGRGFEPRLSRQFSRNLPFAGRHENWTAPKVHKSL